MGRSPILPARGIVAFALLSLWRVTAVLSISLLGNKSGSQNTALRKVGQVTAGPLKISELGCGTWSWGNRLLWDYDTSQDEEIYQAYELVRRSGVTVFDTGKNPIVMACKTVLEELRDSNKLQPTVTALWI